MKKFSSFVVLFFITLQVNAQIQQVPSGNPGQPQLPTPKLKPLKPADLTVSGITFVSIVHNTDTKTYLVKVIVTTRNTGELKSVKTQLQAFTKTPSGAGSWITMGEEGIVNAIDPGKTFSAVYSFNGSVFAIGEVPFDFRVKTDSRNFVVESDEKNNYSEILVIKPVITSKLVIPETPVITNKPIITPKLVITDKPVITTKPVNTIKPTVQIDPKILNDPNLPVLKNPEAMLLLPGNFYILEERFWANDYSRDTRVITEECVANDNRWRWSSTANADGTVTIRSMSGVTPKLIYKDSRIEFQGRLQGQFGLFCDAGEGGGLGAGRRYINTWYLKRISGQEHWLQTSDRLDSFRIKIIPVAEIPFHNIDFVFNTLNGWNISEGTASSHAFTGQPSSVNFIPFYDSPVIPAMPLGGSYWKDLEDKFFAFDTRTRLKHINTSRPGTNRWDRPVDSKTGTLTSQPYYNCGETMGFSIAGTEDMANIKIELFQKLKTPETGSILFSDGPYKLISSSITTGHNNDVARGVLVNITAQKYTVIRIRITDNSTTGHIIIDEIGFSGPRSPGLTAMPRPADPVLPGSVKPIWGAIDMHTHPMSYMGMGGKLMHGQLDGDANSALGDCKCIHGGWGIDNTCGNYVRAEIVNLLDEHYDLRTRRRLEDVQVPHNDHPHEGFPALLHWPLQSSMTHQQMWYEWLRRAKDGGLTAIIALTVNSEILARALGADAPIDDKSTADRQIAELIAFVSRHPDFLDTVSNPTRMRSVVNSGRMAVIIGMEIDNIGNFYKNVPVSLDDIRNEISRLKRLGVSYIFPIHVTDNKFGGAAGYKELFNYANKYNTGQPVTARSPFAYPPVLPGTLMRMQTANDINVGFRYSPLGFGDRFLIRSLAEIIELGGLPLPPPLPDPVATVVLTTAFLTAKVVVDPIILSLKFSDQYQLLKKLYLDPHPEGELYGRISGGMQNTLGLTAEGVFAIKEIMRQGMMIDADHASEKAVDSMLSIASLFDYPINSGHNSLRDRGNSEKTRTRLQMNRIRTLGGMFGIGWEEQTPTVFNSIYTTHLGIMGGNTTFGSDIGGYASTPNKPDNPSKFVNYTDRRRPDFLIKSSMAGTDRTWDYNTEGMAHIGLVPDFFEALKKDGASMATLHQLFMSAEYFARMWEKCIRQAPGVTH